jgi:hypothetical protein
MVNIVNPLVDTHWDRMLDSYPGAGIFHTSAWAKVLYESYGYQPAYLAVKSDDRLLGLLACMEIKSWITGRRGVALPFSDQAEPLITEGVDPAKLLAQILNEGRARGWRKLLLHGGSNLVTPGTPSLAFYTHTLDLLPDRDRLFRNMERGMRNKVRQAQRNGVVVETDCSAGLMNAYYALHCLTRKKHGIPPQPAEFFQSIQRNLLQRGLGFVAIARIGTKPVAGEVVLHRGTQAYGKFSASDESHLHLRGNHLVTWESICRLKNEGFATFDLGRTSVSNEGLRGFKLGLGTKESTIYYHRFDFRKNQFVADQDLASGVHNRIFRLMPMPVLRQCGKILYRHVA